MLHRLLPAFVIVICVLQSSAVGRSMTATLATPGQPFDKGLAEKEYVWPEGVLDLINDDNRTVGWLHWFSECPNDFAQFAFRLKRADDLPRLLDKFEAIKADVKCVILVPASAGKAGIKSDSPVAATLGIGSQAYINRWYVHLKEVEEDGKKIRVWGVHRFTAAPKAAPPILTIYVEHPHIDLQALDLKPETSLIAEIPKEELDRRGKDDKTIKAINEAVADHAAKQKKAMEEKKAEESRRGPVRD